MTTTRCLGFFRTLRRSIQNEKCNISLWKSVLRSVLLFDDPVELWSYFDLGHGTSLAHVDDVPDALGRILGKQVASVLRRRFEVGVPVELGPRGKIRADRNDYP